MDLIGQNTTLLQRKLIFINSLTEKLMKQRIAMKKQCRLRLQSFSVLSRNLNNIWEILWKSCHGNEANELKNRDERSSQEIYMLTAVLGSRILANDKQFSLSNSINKMIMFEERQTKSDREDHKKKKYYCCLSS